MKVPVSWLREYVEVSATAQQIADRLAIATGEVERITRRGVADENGNYGLFKVGRVLEDPFTMFWPALPLSALSTTIEINLRQRLGEQDVPPMPKPNDRGILM